MIRSATQDDFPAMAQVSAVAMPRNPLTETQLNSHQDQLAPTGARAYWVYEADNTVVGFAYCMQWADMYDPQAFHISVQVHPDHQRQGIGTELYATLADALLTYNPLRFQSSIYEDNIGAEQFSKKYGFVEYSRRIESTCDLTTFSGDNYKDKLDTLENAGYEFTVLADITDQDSLQDIYNLQWSLELDVPIEETLIKKPFELWRKQIFDLPSSLSQSSIVVQKEDDYAGLIVIEKLSDTHAYCEFTGIRPQFRRKGLATAIKVHAMQKCKSLGYTAISTTNDAVNIAILNINHQLGYKPKPARIQIEKTFTED